MYTEILHTSIKQNVASFQFFLFEKSVQQDIKIARYDVTERLNNDKEIRFEKEIRLLAAVQFVRVPFFLCNATRTASIQPFKYT